MNKLLQLIQNNARPDRAPTIRAQAAETSVDVYVYDIIDRYWGASAKSLIEALAPHAGKAVSLHINSPGGDVFEARAMVAALRNHGGTITAHIDGVAASSASWLALAADQVHINDGGMVMVHNSWSWTWGNKHELRTTADLLDKIDGTILADYARKTGANPDVIAGWMDAETWFTAAEALDAGLVDVIDTGRTPDDDGAANRWNLGAFSNAPKLPEPPKAADPAAIEAAVANQLRMNRARLDLLNTRI